MSPLIDRTAMQSVFDELVTPSDEALAVVAHAPTRAFLRDVGLPEREQWFEADAYLIDADLRVGGEAWQAVQEEYSSCPYDMSTWLTLGGIGMDTVTVDTVTGIVYCIPEDRYIHVLNSSVDALGFFLHSLEKERPEYDAEAAAGEGFDPEGAEERLRTRWLRTDPIALENPGSSWHTVLRLVRDALMD